MRKNRLRLICLLIFISLLMGACAPQRRPLPDNANSYNDMMDYMSRTTEFRNGMVEMMKTPEMRQAMVEVMKTPEMQGVLEEIFK